jgi:hypothetical protein
MVPVMKQCGFAARVIVGLQQSIQEERTDVLTVPIKNVKKVSTI